MMIACRGIVTTKVTSSSPPNQCYSPPKAHTCATARVVFAQHLDRNAQIQHLQFRLIKLQTEQICSARFSQHTHVFTSFVAQTFRPGRAFEHVARAGCLATVASLAGQPHKCARCVIMVKVELQALIMGPIATTLGRQTHVHAKNYAK